MLWTYRTDDAEVILAGMGSIATEATMAADLPCARRASRPASSASASTGPSRKRTSARPSGTARRSSSSKRTSATATKGALCSDIKAALYGTGIDAPIHNYIAGLGGRDVKARELVEAVQSSLARIAAGERERKPRG